MDDKKESWYRFTMDKNTY